MKKIYVPAVIFLTLVISACKVVIDAPTEGGVVTTSGAYSCDAGETCGIDIVDLFFNEEFVAVPAEGYHFTGWERRTRGLCKGKNAPCHLLTSPLEGFPLLMTFLEDPDEVFYLAPTFMADRFTMEWLSGRIVFTVAFVDGGDYYADHPEVLRINFSEDESVEFDEILNQLYSGYTHYAVDGYGGLSFGGDPLPGVYGVCEVTEDYVQVARWFGGDIWDREELWFFDQKAALAHARSLTAPVNSCYGF